MTESFGFIIGGLLLLTLGGEFLVRAASRVARSFGISPLVIGLTIVAIGTSAPELGVSLFAAINGNPEIALSNVVGSNIFNIAFILGLCAIVSPLAVHLTLIKFDVPIMIGATIVIYLFSLNGSLERYEGWILILAAVAYMFWIVRAARNEPKEISDNIELSPSKTKTKALAWNLFLIVVSLGVLVVGSRLLVNGAVSIAQNFGVSDSLIGLTIVAAGTSLPEVATSLMATIRGQTDIAIGNVIGSNIMNIFFILGVSTSLNDNLIVPPTISYDMLVMLAIAIICYPLLVTAKKLERWEGSLLMSGYIGYIAHLLVRG